MSDGSVQTELASSLQLPDRPSAPREAREHVRRCLRGTAVGVATTDVVLLLASEVVTNALRHAPPPRELRIVGRAGMIRVEVTDSHPLPPRRREPDAGSLGGRGLWLLEALSARWGYFHEGEGKCVWFEVAPEPDA